MLQGDYAQHSRVDHRDHASRTMTTISHADTCDLCDQETSHTVEIEIRTESQKDENAKFSREPYRVATCPKCGTEQTKRLNDA
jgi:ribosomal protein L37AE/L43A